MTLAEATKLRNEYIKILVGKQYDVQRPDWTIKDVIVSNRENAANVYTKMYDDNMTNEMALSFFLIEEDNYDALIIAHQWPWKSEDILVERVENYLKVNSI